MRARRVLVTSMAVVGLGLVAALGAMYLDPARAAVGPLPGVALALPAETRSLTGLDVRRFVASPFYQRYGRTRQGRPHAFSDLEARTGLNPERDVDQVILAAGGAGTRQSATAIVVGRFDRYRLARSVETQKKVTTKMHEGVAVYLFREGSRGAQALAFLDDDVLVLGTQPEVESTVTSHVHGREGLKGNPALLELVQSVRPGATFWTVGDQTLLSQMPQTLPAPGGAGGSFTLPGLKSLVVTGDLEPSISFEAVAQAADEASARQLGDVVRGLIALASLQAAQKPELQQLASALTVTNEAARVRVNGRVTYELLDALQGRAPAGLVPPTSPATGAPIR